MRQEYDTYLCENFPNLYRNRHGDMRTTALCWGFEIGDGWYEIVKELSRELELEILKLPKADREYACASQVKEKYGGLRFYMHSETNEMSWLIREAEQRASKTCEQCGSSAKCRNENGWYTTLCDKCYLDRAASAVVRQCLYSTEVCDREAKCVRLKNETELYSSIADLLDAYFDILPVQEEKDSLRERLEYIVRWKIISPISYMRYGWWWKRFPSILEQRTKYKWWRLKRWMSKKL